MQYLSVKARILNTLRGKRKYYTARDLTDRLDLTEPNRVYSAISLLIKEGHSIVKSPNKEGEMRYRIG